MTAGVGAGLAGLVAAPPVAARKSWLRRASYAAHVGERFRARSAGGATVTLRLERIDDLVGTTPSGASLTGRDDAFLLVFSGPATSQLAQGVSELQHRALGRTRMFMVPRAHGNARATYAVVVHRAHG